MTNEEAEQLINEIQGYVGYDNTIEFMTKTAKVIKRFANKPPYVTEITFSFSEPMQLILYNDDNHTKDASLAICHQDKRDAIGISKQELEMLRNNCIKMLEWLSNDR